MTFTLCVRKFSQYEMVVTQWAFVGPALLWPDKLGISVTSPETEEVGTNRFTAVISYILLLICQKLNLCIFLYSLNLNGSFSQGLAGLVHVMYLVGRELGIREELNMCAGDLTEVRQAAREILISEIQVSEIRYSPRRIR